MKRDPAGLGLQAAQLLRVEGSLGVHLVFLLLGRRARGLRRARLPLGGAERHCPELPSALAESAPPRSAKARLAASPAGGQQGALSGLRKAGVWNNQPAALHTCVRLSSLFHGESTLCGALGGEAGVLQSGAL